MDEVTLAVGLIVRPGDTLIVGFAQHMTLDVGAQMRERIRERIPGLADVMLITGGVTALAAYRPEVEEVPANADA